MPNFINTIEAMEFADIELERITTTFFNLFSACSNDTFDKESDTVSTLLAELGNDIQLDEQLFEKIKTVYDNQEQDNLSPEQTILLKKYYENFSRNGALLNNDDKTKLRSIDSELAPLGPKYSQNLLNSTNAFHLEVTDAKDLEGLPQTAIVSAKELAVSKEKHDSWLFSLQAPSFMPFMTYCSNRKLREQLWMAYNTRAFSGETSNEKNCERISELRHQRALLLGFSSHADFVLTWQG